MRRGPHNKRSVADRRDARHRTGPALRDDGRRVGRIDNPIRPVPTPADRNEGMGATLEALQRLQRIETQLRSVRGQIENKRRSVQAFQRRLATLERQIADTHELIRQAQAEADRLELDRKSHEEHIKRLRERLNQTKTNKEYAAVLTQLNTDKADALRTEDKVLAAMAKVDDLKAREAGYRATLEKEKARLADMLKSAAEVEARLSAELKEIQAQRAAAAEEVPPEALRTFERARDKHDGEAMAMVEQTHPRRAEYICSGCNMSIPLETINSLQSRDEVQVCHICSRILYLDTTGAAAH